MKFKKNYLILGSLLSTSVIPMVAMSCATTKTDDKKPMEVKEDKEKDKAGASATTPSADKQGTNTPASTTPKSNATDTSNQAGKTETPASGTSGTGKAEGDSAGKAGTDAEANGTAGQPATPPSSGQGTNADTAMSS